ncbi:MAG: MFS transporter, partial [Planctomycetes bacterium]|nr:MFS transporter [Planctomycetota bacterium]
MDEKVKHSMVEKGVSRISFVSLSGASFMGALNDNVFKLLLIYFLMEQRGVELSEVMAPVGFVFAVPYLLFLAWSGNMADRMSKRHIIVVSKGLEVLSMVLGCAAFASGQTWAAFIVLFLMSAQSAIYGPSKYGIIPELVNREQLSKANGLIEMLTFVAIIVGTGLAPLIYDLTGGLFWVAGIWCVCISGMGFLMSLGIHVTPAAGGRKRPSVVFFKDIFETLGSIRSNRALMLSVIASACFLLLGAFIQMNVMPYGVERLGLSDKNSTYLFLPGALGIGLGALLAGRLSGRGVEIGLIPLGTMILGLSQILLGWAPATATAVGAMIFLGGFGSGLFIVPIQTLIQVLCDRKNLGRVLAAASFIGWLGVLAAAGALHLLNNEMKLAPSQSFVVMGVLTLGMMLVMLRVVPEFFVRLLLFIATRFIYRIRTSGIENIPIQGGGLLVANHVTLVDGLLLNATQQRMIRFVMARDQIEKKRWLGWLFRLVRVIPISEDDPPRQLLGSIREVREALSSGQLVFVFAEGHLTHTGVMLSFKGGV